MSSAARRGLAAGLLLMGAGAGWLLEATGVVDLAAQTWIGLLLVALGAAIVLDAGHSHGLLVTLGVLIALVGIPAAAIDDDLVSGGIGDRSEAPTSVAEIDDPYRLGIGQLVVDLTALEAAGQDASVEASVGMGQLRVVVPLSASVDVEAHASMGNVSLFGQDEGGFDVHVTRNVEGLADGGLRVVLDLDVGLGEVRVERG